MDYWNRCKALLLFILIKIVTSSSETFDEDTEKIDLRRELDKITQDLLVKKDPFYHSYVFNSGVGNREELAVEWMRQEVLFGAGQDVVRWQAVRNLDQVHLLGQKQSSVVLMTASAQLSSNRSLQFEEHSISFDANVTSSSLLIRLNRESVQPEVIVVVALDTAAADLIFYRITNNKKLEHITQWARYKKVSCISAVSVNGKIQLILIDKGSSVSIDVFEVLFPLDSVHKLDFRLVQSLAVAGDCGAPVVCRAGHQHYLVLPLPTTLAVYRLTSGRYQFLTELPLPQVTQVVCFNVALQTYLAVSGDSAQVIRVTEGGEFVFELMPEMVREWMVLPVVSYRSDVLLLGKTANGATGYVWAGANRGFKTVSIPNCDGCLDGNWSGAMSVPFQHQNCLIIPGGANFSHMVRVGTALHSTNPVLEKLVATVEYMKKYEDEWQHIKSRIAELEETLRFVVKTHGTNVVTGKWTFDKLESPSLKLNGSMVEPQNETKTSAQETDDADRRRMQLKVLEASVKNLQAEREKLLQAVEHRERQAWSLDGFKGKVRFNGRLSIDNLTVNHLNDERADQLLLNTFRKDKPNTIQQKVTVEALRTEEIVVNRIKNVTKEDLKFADGVVVINGNITLEKPLVVRGGVELVEGRVNGVDLSKELCHGLNSCSVFPMANLSEEDIRSGSLISNIDESPTASVSGHSWSTTIGGKNLTVVKVNGVDWKTLTENVVYKNMYQNISGDIVVTGKVTSVPAVWSNSFQSLSHSEPRSSDSGSDPNINMSASSMEESYIAKPPDSNREILDRLPSTSTLIVAQLEVAGSVTVAESEWGADAADVVLSDANPIVIDGPKMFRGVVNVTNNAQVVGTVGGVELSNLLTKDTDQLFNGPIHLLGNVSVENLSLTGMWNGKNLADVATDKHEEERERVVTAQTVNVLDTINQVPVSQFIFTGLDGITKISSVSAEELSVSENIVVNGKMCGVYLDDFNERRLSLSKDQEITGKVVIKEAEVKAGFQVGNLSIMEMPYFAETDIREELHLSELHIEGDLTTDEGVNGFNLSEVAANAVWLDDNNEIEGPLIFKDEVAFDILEGQERCNGVECDQWLNAGSVVFKHNTSVTFTGLKTFAGFLNVSEDLEVTTINHHKIEDVLTKTTEQEIMGNLIVHGDIKVEENSTVLGLMNNQNLTELGHKCSVSENTITCKGNAVFKENVEVEHLTTAGMINGVDYLPFLKSIVRTDNPQHIDGLKKLMGHTSVQDLVDVDEMNGEHWDQFLSDAVSAEDYEQVERDVTFSEALTVDRLSVDYEMAVGTVNSINISQWRTDAVYINESHALDREIVVESASSKGNITVEALGGLSLELDIIRLHSASSLPQLRAPAITVLADFDAAGKVNGHHLGQLEQNTLKTMGDQILHSEVIVGDVVVEGNVDTDALVNEQQLREAVSLVSHQTLHGKYEFECVEAQESVDTSEMVSGINVTSWAQSAVLKGGSDQNISGVWRVLGSVEMKGGVTGGGRLGNVELQQLTDNIKTNMLDVHTEMKSNLTGACEEANARLASARAQHTQLHHVDVTQVFSVPSGPSLVTHFKSKSTDFLAISENSCITTIYKWSNSSGIFRSLYREHFGYSLKNFIILNNEEITYVLTESGENSTECSFNGKHLWIFMDDHFKHITNVNFFAGDLFQGEDNTLYAVNSLGMFKYVLSFDKFEGRAFFEPTPYHWNISADVPKAWSGAVEFQWLSSVYSASNCSGQMVSVAVEPSGQFVAVASTEPAEVPSSSVQIYRRDGKLFDKLSVQNVKQLQWLSVPSQTWLLTLEKNSLLNLFQLQGSVVGFQLQRTIQVEATKVTSLVLPLTFKVNLQPFLIIQSSTTVKLVQAFVQGDPYLGQDLVCGFDQILTRVPRN